MSQDRRAVRTDLRRSLMTRRQMLRVGLSLAALPLFAACGQAAAPAPTAAAGQAGRAAKPAAPAATTAPAAAAPAEARRGRQAGRGRKPAQAAPAPPASEPPARLKMLLWQAPTILNPHLSPGHQGLHRRALLHRAADDRRRRGQVRAGPGRRGPDRAERRPERRTASPSPTS